MGRQLPSVPYDEGWGNTTAHHSTPQARGPAKEETSRDLEYSTSRGGEGGKMITGFRGVHILTTLCPPPPYQGSVPYDPGVQLKGTAVPSSVHHTPYDEGSDYSI